MANITHIFKAYFPESRGGMEEAIRQYANHAITNGFDVQVVSVGSKSWALTSPEGVRIRFYKKSFEMVSNPFSVDFARAFRHICRDTDLLHFHFPWPTAELLTLLHGINRPTLLSFQCDIYRAPWLKLAYLPFMKQFLKKMDKICVSSNNLMENTPVLQPFKDKIEIIPMFIDEQRFSGLTAPAAELVQFVEKIGPYSLFTGVLRWYKGLDVLLDAAGQIDSQIVIVGNGPLYGRLAKRIHKERLSNVHLLGFQEDHNLKFLMEQARCMVLPSIVPAEAFGQALLEGLYFSKPLVATELGTGTSYVNRHNHTGLVVPPKNSRALAEAINTIVANDALCEEFSKNAFCHYLSHFTAQVQGDQYLRVYNDLLKAG